MARKATARPAWWAGIEARLDHLRHLSLGWDGYRAPPVVSEIADWTLLVLEQLCGKRTPLPSIVPGGSGDLQIEWHTLDWDVELDIPAPGRIEAWRLNSASGREQTLVVEGEFAELRTWVAELEEPGFASRSATA